MRSRRAERLYLYHIVVRSEYRNRGIGTALIDAADTALKKEGITHICLNVMESNEAGKGFRQSRGWEKKDFLGLYSKSVTDKENKPMFEV